MFSYVDITMTRQLLQLQCRVMPANTLSVCHELVDGSEAVQ